MANSDTGPLGTLTFISAEEVDPEASGTPTHLRVRYSLDVTGASEALVGFLIWHDNETGSTTPVWLNACDASVAGGGDAGDPVIYEVIVPNPLSTTGAIWWESFEEYALGSSDALDKGGMGWDGAWSEMVLTSGVEDFESYTPGVQGSPMGGGTGWDGDWTN